jgi:hypothetical protein
MKRRLNGQEMERSSHGTVRAARRDTKQHRDFGSDGLQAEIRNWNLPITCLQKLSAIVVVVVVVLVAVSF